MRAPRRGRRRRGSLVVVGTGITLAHQITLEALDSIQRAEKLFYLVPNPAMALWIQGLNRSAEALDDCYAEGKPRHQTYRDIATRIVGSVRSGREVCAAFYGHPGVMVDPSHAAIRRARAEGFPARMLPGVSAEDCLFADVGIERPIQGWQCYEATDFLAARRRIDPSSALILWQVGLLGESSVRKGMTCRPERLRVLAQALRPHYPGRHPIILYEASQFPICEPRIDRTTVGGLSRQRVEPQTTLYLPPRRAARAMNRTVARWLAE